MRRYGLHDDEWERIEDLLPGRERNVGVTAKDNRRFVEAVLYRYRTGMPWRDLPERFGDWKAVHTRFTAGLERRLCASKCNPRRHLHFRKWLAQSPTAVRGR
jgi:transposase